MRRVTLFLVVLAASLALVPTIPQAAGQGTPAPATQAPTLVTAETCLSCHTGLVSPLGRDVSFGSHWRASMMANAARDPYWQAGVRREVLDHPTHQSDIEHECSACHMPADRYLAKIAGKHGAVFANLPVGASAAPGAALAADGVTCSLCHQIANDGLGVRSRSNGGFTILTSPPGSSPTIVGPFEVDAGRTRIMHSAAGFSPAQASYIQESAVCANCHTLITTSLGPDGKPTGELPEQAPYLEWEHSAYRTTRSCQSCHMAEHSGQTQLSGVLGELRANVSAHSFVGGNFFMKRVLNRYRGELGVEALPEELDGSARETEAHLAAEAASLAIDSAALTGSRLVADMVVANLAGHKLPTAYPSRRAWLHVTLRDGNGQIVFESGALDRTGRITGNDNDTDGARYEPHYTEITSPDQVQIYEPVLGDPAGRVTTGLLTAVQYLKDNRLLPNGFDKATASKDVAVHGAAATDPDFAAGGDRIRYSIDVGAATGPFRVTARLYYQPIGYRWAKNLEARETFEGKRFLRYWDDMASASAAVLAHADAVVR